MPTIAFFYGIAIRMFHRDHNPPHFQAVYAEFEANVDIATGEIMDGRLPRTARRIVKSWTQTHQAALLENWRRCRDNEPLERLPGPDDHVDEDY